MHALTYSGWILAAALAIAVARLRARLELVARAEHELRGPLTAFTLALDAARGTTAGRRLAVVLDAELARARVALCGPDRGAAGPAGSARERAAARRRLLRSSAAAWGRSREVDGAAVRSSAGEALSRRGFAQALGNAAVERRRARGGETSRSTQPATRTASGSR